MRPSPSSRRQACILIGLVLIAVLTSTRQRVRSQLELEPLCLAELSRFEGEHIAIALGAGRGYLGSREGHLEIVDLREPHRPSAWGHAQVDFAIQDIAVDGDLLLLVLDDGSVRVLDVGLPGAARELAQIVGPFDRAAISGHHAVLWNEQEMRGFDLRQPDRPRFRDRRPIGAGSIELLGTRIYVAGPRPEGLRIIDIQPNGRWLDRGRRTVQGFGLSVAVRDDRAYLGRVLTGQDYALTSPPPTFPPPGPTRTPAPLNRQDPIAPPGPLHTLAPDRTGILMLDVSNPDVPSYLREIGFFRPERLYPRASMGDLIWFQGTGQRFEALVVDSRSHEMEFRPFCVDGGTGPGPTQLVVDDGLVLIAGMPGREQASQLLWRAPAAGAFTVHLPWQRGGRP